jgi:fumarylacetoacetate (FAA) hydrolase
MKLASIAGPRDGNLAIVSKDLQRMYEVGDRYPNLQCALDSWKEAKPWLQTLSEQLEDGRLPSKPFVQADCASPLPRAFQWADGSAYVNHVELVRKARNAEMPDTFWTEPLMYQGGSDTFLNPYSPIVLPNDDELGIDFEAEVAVITDDVPMGVNADEALKHIKLIMLVNDVSLRGLIPAELAKGLGFYQSKPSSAFSPVCVTPDELADCWHNGKLHLPLLSSLNTRLFGKPNAGIDMTFHFGQLIAHAARTRNLAAGTIIGSGTVSNKYDGGPGKTIADGGVGYSCIAELRMIEIIQHGKANTAFMQNGDCVKIEMLDSHGLSIFGEINQTVLIKP